MQESTTTIALALGRSQSSISRELGRNCSQRGYWHKQAHGKAVPRHVDKPKAVKLAAALVDSLEGLLERQWSPNRSAAVSSRSASRRFAMKPSTSMC